MMAGRRNCARLASGSRQNGVKRMGGTHFHQMDAITMMMVAIQKPGMASPPMATVRNR